MNDETGEADRIVGIIELSPKDNAREVEGFRP